MNLEKGSMIQIDGINCCVLNLQNIDGIDYIYVAEIFEDDITENFYLYKITSDGKFEKVTNTDDFKKILPTFIQSMDEDLINE